MAAIQAVLHSLPECAMYESDVTKFIRELMEKNPHLAEEQRKARSRWWDKKIDLEEQRRYKEVQEPIRGYYYYPLPEPKRPAAPQAREENQAA
ncbi:MAG: DUF3460 family protein [Pseudomonadota bacterium]